MTIIFVIFFFIFYLTLINQKCLCVFSHILTILLCKNCDNKSEWKNSTFFRINSKKEQWKWAKENEKGERKQRFWWKIWIRTGAKNCIRLNSPRSLAHFFRALSQFLTLAPNIFHRAANVCRTLPCFNGKVHIMFAVLVRLLFKQENRKQFAILWRIRTHGNVRNRSYTK